PSQAEADGKSGRTSPIILNKKADGSGAVTQSGRGCLQKSCGESIGEIIHSRSQPWYRSRYKAICSAAPVDEDVAVRRVVKGGVHRKCPEFPSELHSVPRRASADVVQNLKVVRCV